MKQKQMYEAPATEVLELKLEGGILSNSFGDTVTWDEDE